MSMIPRRLIPLLAAIALATPPAPARTPAQVRPALWKVERGSSTLYLFGTIHLLPAGTVWRDRTIDAAMARSRSLTLEVVVDQDPKRIASALAALAFTKGLPPLVERVPANRRAALTKLIAASGTPPAVLDGMETWAAAIVLLGPAMQAIGLEAGSGVEPELSRIFRAAGKPVDELETPAQQLGYFDALPEPSQRTFLVQTLNDPAKAKGDFDRLVSAWARGDTAGLEKAFADDPEFTPELRASLVAKRDAAWAEALAKRLDTPGVGFVAVGAGHLVGPDSVQAMLARAGIRATRVQ